VYPHTIKVRLSTPDITHVRKFAARRTLLLNILPVTGSWARPGKEAGGLHCLVLVSGKTGTLCFEILWHYSDRCSLLCLHWWPACESLAR